MFTPKELDRILEAYIKYMEREYPEGCYNPVNPRQIISARERAIMAVEVNASRIGLAYTTAGEYEDYDLHVWLDMPNGTTHFELFDPRTKGMHTLPALTYQTADELINELRTATFDDWICELQDLAYDLD